MAADNPGPRRQARERALSLLYEADAKGASPAAVLADQPLEAEPFVAELVTGVESRQAELDGLISRHLIDWPFERLATIDRTVLRLATFELVALPAVPTAVVLDEAVELAKRYSTEDSGRFVNGVLAAVARTVREGGTVTT